MDLIEIIKRDLSLEEKLLRDYESRLKCLPKGGLVFKKKGKRIEYYHVAEKTRKHSYISAQNSELIEALKTKKYLQVAAKTIRKNISAEEKMVALYQPYTYAAIQRRLPAAYKNDWETADVSQKKTVQPLSGKVHTVTSGLKVRSKSEAMIAETLNFRDLLFEYETPLELYDDGNKITFHPDFTFETEYGEKIYWEHFGMLGVESYRNSALRKLDIYIRNGIIPSINLIITAEDLDGTLDVRTILRAINMIEDMI